MSQVTESPVVEPIAPSGSDRSLAARAMRVGRRRALPIVTLICVGLLWELLANAEVVSPLALPPPSDVFTAWADLVGQPFYWDAVKVTLLEALLGFGIGAGAGFLLGTLIGLNSFMRGALYPLAVAFQTTPQVALAPLFLIWFGFGLMPRIMFAATTCFFPVLVSVIVGLQTADRDARRLLTSFGVSRWQEYRKLLLPASLPVVFAGVRTSATLALIGAIVGEFVGGDRGMGVLITTFNYQLQIAETFAVVLSLAVIGLTVYGIVELIDRRVVFWQRH
jgi:NitT/TauT family transport system permease protein